MEDGGKRSEDGGGKKEESGKRTGDGGWKMEEMATPFLTLQSSFLIPCSSFLASLPPGASRLVGDDELIPLGARRSVSSYVLRQQGRSQLVPAFAAVG